MNKIIGSLWVAATLILAGTAAVAQEGPDYNGPDEASIMAEVGAPDMPSGEIGPSVQRPSLPGIPSEARAVIPDKDFVEVYCLMTRGRAAGMMAALDALETHLVPALQDVFSVTGSFDAPDVAALRQQANGLVDEVCQSATPEEASAAIERLVDFGESVRGQFVSLRSEMTSRLKAKGDELRSRIESQVRAKAEAEKASAQAELDAYGAQLGSEAQSSLESEMSGKTFDSGEAAEAYVNGRMSSVRANITSKVQARANELRSGIESRLRAEAESAAGGDKAKFESLAAKLGGLGDKINAATSDGQSKGESYLAQARAKRKAMVLAVVDQNVAAAQAELEKNREQIEEARKDNPEVKSVEGILAELADDRSALASAIDRALANDDEAAFSSAIDSFREKWEGYRANVEKAFYSVSAICSKAGEGLSQARSRLDAGYKEISGLQAKCADSVTDECLRVNGFAARFAAVTGKMDAMKSKLADVEAACASEDTDIESLLALLDEVKASGEDLQAYGEAFAAEKQKAMAESAAQICDQALPPLKAARVELKNDDLAALEASLTRCRGSQTDECAAVNSVGGEFRTLKLAVDSFLSDADKLEAACGSDVDEGRFLEMRDLALYLKGQGDTLKSLAKDLKVKQSEKSSQQTVCAAAGPSLETAKKAVSDGVSEAKTTLAECAGKTDDRCAAISARADRINSVVAKAESTLQRISSALASCRQAGTGPADTAFLNELTAIRNSAAELKSLVADLKAEGDSRWPGIIKSGKPFKVVFDVSPSVFDDSQWTGDWRTDQMGTIRGGETYTLTYGTARGWSANGINEATGKAGTWTYRYGDPDAFQIDIWGRVYKFDAAGAVYDQEYGLVGHLVE